MLKFKYNKSRSPFNQYFWISFVVEVVIGSNILILIGACFQYFNNDAAVLFNLLYEQTVSLYRRAGENKHKCDQQGAILEPMQCIFLMFIWISNVAFSPSSFKSVWFSKRYNRGHASHGVATAVIIGQNGAWWTKGTVHGQHWAGISTP